jgi:lysophospholipase L1-like esterase
VNSQYARILALNPHIRGLNYNDAKSGAKMADLAGQLNSAATQHVDYVTVLMGANDACNSNVLNMTSTDVFQSEFASALGGFFAQDPTAHVYVSSLPNVGQLYTLFRSNSTALSVWKTYNICQDVLPPGGNDSTRATVYNQEVLYNSALQTVCAQYPSNCLYDGGAGFGYNFATSEVSSIDYFHPSVTGQKDIAALTWSKSYWGA